VAGVGREKRPGVDATLGRRGPRDFAPSTKATPAAITTAAMPMDSVRRSPPKPAPSATAMSGLTYACVPTRDAGATLRRNM